MDDRERLTTAKQLIQEKEYAAAHAILRTMPHNQTAMSWLAKLDRAIPQAEDQKESKKSSGCIQRIIVTLVFIGILTLGLMYYLQTLPVPYGLYEIAGTCPANRWGSVNEKTISEFLDQADAAQYSSRSSLGTYIAEMNSVKRTFDDAPYPKCIEAGRDQLSSGMAQAITGFEWFASGDSLELASVPLGIATDDFKAAYNYFLHEHFVFLDNRLALFGY